MKLLINYLTILVFVFSVTSAYGKNNQLQKKPQKQTISDLRDFKKSYPIFIEKLFNHIISIGKQSKTAKDFYSKMFDLEQLSPKDKLFIESQIANQKAPKVIKIKNGIALFEGENKATIQSTSKLGELLLNGKIFFPDEKKSLRNYFEAKNGTKNSFNFYSLLVPNANAAVPLAILAGLVATAAQHAIVGFIVGAVISKADRLMNLLDLDHPDIDKILGFTMAGIFGGVHLSDKLLFSKLSPKIKNAVYALKRYGIYLAIAALVGYIIFDLFNPLEYQVQCGQNGEYSVQSLRDKKIIGDLYRYDGKYLIIGNLPASPEFKAGEAKFSPDDSINGESGFIKKNLLIQDLSSPINTEEEIELNNLFSHLLERQANVSVSEEAFTNFRKKAMEELKEKFKYCLAHPGKIDKFIFSDIGKKIRVDEEHSK